MAWINDYVQDFGFNGSFVTNYSLLFVISKVSREGMEHVIHYVTGNKGKFEEVKAYLKTYAPSIRLEYVDLDLAEPQTLDQTAIAIHKAKEAWKIVRKPLLIDDAGAYLHAYNNFPGVFTKFVYEGIGLKGLFKLIDEDNRVSFRLFLAYIEAPDHCKVFEGRCDGMIVPPPVGVVNNPKLPYDAIFIPEGETQVYAQLRGTERFHEYAYRLRAVKKFLAWYQAKNGV